MRLWALGALALVSLGFSGCSRTTPERHIAGYEAIVAGKKQVLVLPANVYLEIVDYSGYKERAYDYEQHIAKIIDNEITPAIEEKGFKAKRLSHQEIQNSEVKRRLVREIKSSYSSSINKLYDWHYWDEKEAFNIRDSIGAVAIELGEITSSDLLVLVDFSGFTKTKEAKNMDAIQNVFSKNIHQDIKLKSRVSPAEGSAMIIGVIDAQTGMILWANKKNHGVHGLGQAFESFQHNHQAGTRAIQETIRSVLYRLRKMPMAK